MPPTWFMTHIWPILQTIHLSSKQYTKPIQHIPISPICLYLGSLLSIFWPTLFCISRHLAVQPHPITPIYQMDLAFTLGTPQTIDSPYFDSFLNWLASDLPPISTCIYTRHYSLSSTVLNACLLNSQELTIICCQSLSYLYTSLYKIRPSHQIMFRLQSDFLSLCLHSEHLRRPSNPPGSPNSNTTSCTQGLVMGGPVANVNF